MAEPSGLASMSLNRVDKYLLFVFEIRYANGVNDFFREPLLISFIFMEYF